MSSGYFYHTKLSEKECIERFENFLKVIKKDYNFLWNGNPSLILKYGSANVLDRKVDSGKQICIDSFLLGDINSFGIIRTINSFYFYLKFYDGSSLITNSQTTYKNLNNSFDLKTKACFSRWAESIRDEIESILSEDFKEKMKELEEKLK